MNYGFYKVEEDWQLPCTHPDCIATREAMKDVMRFWLDRGCDGFRVDMASSLVKNDREKKGTCALWKNVREMLDRDYPEAALVAEWCDPMKSLKAGFHCDFYLNRPENGYYSLFRDVDAPDGEDRSFFSPEGRGDITRFVDEYLSMYAPTKRYGYISFLTCNHDTKRLAGRLDERTLKLAYAFLFTMPGVPFLYYGDEIGMRYQKDLVSKEGGYERTGSRTPMQWTQQKNAGFSDAASVRLYLPVDGKPGAPCVETQEGRKDSLLHTVRSIIRFRQGQEDLRADGPFQVLYAESGKYPFVYRRGRFILGVNPSARQAEAPVSCSGKIVFSIGEKAEIDF